MLPKPTKNILLVLFFFAVNLAAVAQTNPIIDLVNDPNNDVNGNIAVCSNDGSSLPKIFLCGADDVANLTVNYPGAQSILWEKLDESSCTNFGDDCTNRSPSCVYNTVASGSTFPVNDGGKYRLRVVQGNGVSENHYFHVYQNTLEVLYQKADIGCEPTGNITVTNLGSTYGFQLVNADSGQILVPFSADNGPTFVITADGNYRVEVMQLNPNTGDPIENGCLFSTPAIAVGTSNFSVQASSTEADCEGVGTVSITASNGTPNYAYELRLDDGLDGGRGTLIDVVTNQTANTYTFTGVGQGDYLVVGRNSDGCEQSAPTTVIVGSENTLTFEARVSQHITCKEGNILVDPDGGKPPYRYAVWKYVDEQDNAVTTYGSPSEIPNQEFQTSEIFDILAPGNYSFVVIDRFGCFTISNSVDIEFVPPAEFGLATVTHIACFGEPSGAIQMNLIDSNGYQIHYYLFDRIITTDEANAPGFSFADAIDSNSSGYFPGLPAGEYTVVPNMRKGSAECNFAENITIESPDSELAGEAILIQPYTCTQTGTIRADNVGGGTPFNYGIGVPGYDFSLNGANWQSGNDTFIGLSPGIYTIFIRDAAGCIVETNEVEILPVESPEDLIFVPTQITCDDTTSDLTITIVGGTAPFDIQMTSPSVQGPTSITGNIAVFENLSPGTYTFLVSDSNECTYEESFTILPITEIGVVGELLENISCEGLNDGALRYTVNGFETTYSYIVVNSAGTTIDSGNVVTNNVILLDNQPGETYTITVTDDVTTCTDTAVVTIEAPDTPLDASLAVTDLSCSLTGTNPGSVVITATGGWGSYEYELTEPSGATQGPQSSNVFDNLTDTSGTYTVLVRDAGNCEYTETFTLSPVDLPVLEITANSLCYDSVNGLTLTATVTSGGDGNFRYRLNNGGYTTNNVFSGLAPGTYTIDVIDGRNCTASDQITVSPQMDVSASALPIASCENDTEVLITASGGDGNFVYAVVPAGTTPSTGNFGTSSTVTVSSVGDYDVYVRDNGGATEYCEATDTVTITQDPGLVIDVTLDPQVIPCSGENNGSITVTATGGATPYLFSVDGGATFQTNNTFVNLPSGDYTVVVRDNNNCEVSEVHNIPETFTLSASAAVTQSPTCNPDDGTEVRILNAQGGTQPYEYSFDGGNTFSASNAAFLQPGTHLLILQDANGCPYEMTVTIDPAPEDPTFTHDTTYDCTGEGTVTVTPSSTDFNYTYTLDGTINTPADSNVFNNVSPGYHTVTVDYLPTTPLAPSVLLSESFGAGTNTAITEIDPVYCYEPQNGNPNSCGWSVNPAINDGEYSVTQAIANPFGTWISPNDHTGGANGRYLAINVGGVAGVNGIIYAKRNIDVVANRDITVSLFAINLLRTGTSGGDPSINIQLVDGSGTVIASTATGAVPKNNGPDDWRNYTVTLNPGANSNLDIVIRTNSAVVNGNDIAVDDITATQAAEDCPQQEIFQVYVDEAQALTAAITAQVNPLCVSDNNGSIAFEVENFDATAGFVYSTDSGGSFSAPQTTSPVTLSNLPAGTYDIIIQDATNAACTTTISATLTDPTPLVASASPTQEMTCTNMTAVITANATGGTPIYEYQLENTAGAVITPYQPGNVFTVTTAGDYNVRVRDANNCEDLTDTSITIEEPETVAFDVNATTCYSGNNDASIQLDVTAGNGNYQFQIDNGPWLTPSPTTATTYTFGSLPAGSYTVNVKDGLGCIGTAVSVTINPVLTAVVDVAPISSCADGSITATATGGDGNYVYAFVPTGNDPNASFGPSNSYTVSAANSGSYDVYVRDNAGNAPFCEYVQTVTLDAPELLAFTATPADPQCNGQNGSISVNITAGERPYDLELRDLDNGNALVATYTDQLVATRTFYNVPPGNYEVVVIDGFGCPATQSPIVINDPDALTADIDPILPANCDDPDTLNYGFQFINYPTTLNGTLQFSDNGGQTWSTSDTFMGHISGSSVFPSIRTVDALGNTLCREDFPRYIIPYPLDDLNITVLPQIADCVELRVQVQGSEGDPPYEYTFTDNPANFDPNTVTWDGPFVASYVHQYNGLTPGRTYVFYVRDDAGCIRQSSVNVNDLVVNPFEITGNFEPSCFGANDGSIDFTIVNNSGTTYPEMHWEFYDLNTGAIVQQSPGNVAWTNTLSFSGLAPSEYYVVVTGVDAANTDQCISGSENQLIIEQQPISADLVPENMTCTTPGYIFVNNINGGGGSFTFNVTGPAGFTAITGTTNNPIQIPAGSPTGTYTVTVVDQFNCEFVDDVSLTLPDNPTIDTIAIDNCADPTTVTITASGPSTDFVYSIDGGATYVDNGGVFTNIAAGNYTVGIRDGNGCAATQPITVHPVLQARAELTKLLDCTANPEAEITIEALSGSSNYDIAINNGTIDVVTRIALATNPYIFSTPDAGTYTITIWDTATDPECFRELVVTVPELVEPAFNPVPVDVTCFGGNDGAIIVNELDLGIGPIAYALTPAVEPYNATTGRFENLLAGTYSITATAANECPITINGIVVGEPDEIQVLDPVVIEFGCTGGNNPNNATITVDPSGIIGGSNTYLVYEFINDATGAILQRGSLTTYTETDLAGGDYTINVYDDNGCEGTTNAAILPYDELQDATITVGPVTCVPGNDGTLTVAVTSSQGSPLTDFEFSLDNGGAYQDPNVFSGLSAGNYLVTVRHKETKCIITANATIKEPNTFAIEFDVVQDVVCFGTDSGEVTLQFTDATYIGDFNYTVYDTNGTPADLADDINVYNGIETVNTVTPVITLGAGSYRVEATQVAAPQCTQETIFSIGTPQEAITAEARKMDITCVPGNDGIIEIFNADGGWGGYSYYVGTTSPVDATSYVTNPRFENLIVGTYQAWVIDNRGCEFEIPGTIELTDPVAIEAHLQVNSENCEGANGEVEVIIDVAGGQGENYSYQLIKDSADFGPPQTTPIFSGLGAGSYEVRVYDQWGCEMTTLLEVLYEPMVASYDIVQTIDCDAQGEVTVTVTGGSGNFEYQVTKPDGVVITNTDGIFTALDHTGDAPADYVFVVTDLDTDPQCATSITVSLDKPTPVTIEDILPTPLSCPGSDDGTLTIVLEPTADGVNDNPIYSYTIINTAPGSTAITQDSPLFTNLEPGDYNITVTSGRGCFIDVQETIIEPDVLEADDPTATQFFCDVDNAVQVATINVENIRGGTPNYFYSIDGGINYFPVNGTSISHSVTEAGTYTIFIRDDKGCPLTSLPPVTILPLPQIELSITEGPADCQSGQEITVTSTGHSTPTDLTFELVETGELQANLTTDSAVFNLTEPGIYNVKVTDNVTGCYEYIEHTIDPRPEWSIAISATTPITCFGDTNGTIEVAFTGYTGAYTYELMEGMGDENQPPVLAANQGTQTSTYPLIISDLPPGNYFVRVTPTDYPYCELEETLVTTIESPAAALTVEVQELLASGCPNDMGEISVVPTGGYAPYNITLTHDGSGQPYQALGVAANVFTDLPSGSYTIDVVDAQGCPWSGAGNVAPTPPIDATATGIAPVCYDDPDGSITVTATGGSGVDNFNYFINYYDETGTTIEFTPAVPQQSNEFRFLGEGYYSVTVTDDMGCTDTTDIIFLDGPDQLIAEVALTTAMTCESPAIVTATVTGGTAPYQYQLEDIDGNIITPFQSANTFPVNDAGSYRVRVTDANNCGTLSQVPVIVPEIPPVQLSIDFASASVNCTDDATASIYASAIGGIGEYTFDLILGGTTIATLTDFRKVAFEDIGPGDYTVRVTSEGGCEPDEELVSIANPEPLIFDFEPTHISCTDEMDGAITLMLSGGGGGYQFAISPNLDQFFDEDPSQGLPVGQYRFENLEPGTYTVIAQDANGCFYVEDIEIINPEPVAITVDSILAEGCEGDTDGSVTLTLSGGTAPYNVVLQSDAIQFSEDGDDTVTFDGLSTGTYFATVKDANGCDDTISVEIPGGVNLTATVVPFYECDSNRVMNYLEITFEDETVSDDALYALDSDNINDAGLSRDFRNMAAGDHFVTIFHGRCVRSYPFNIEDYLPVSLALENNNINEITAIATDGLPPYTFYFDDVNNGEDNTYMINRSGTYVVRVIDQNGCEDIQSIEMEFIDIEIPNFFTPDGDGMNDFWIPENIEGWPEILIKIYDRYGRVVSEQVVNSQGWDGTYNSKALPTGDYWYVIKLNGENDDREFMGHFTLYR